MKRHQGAATHVEQRTKKRSGHAVAASAFLAAGLSCAVFITLFRAPMPVDAFAALAQQIAATGSGLAS